MARSNNVYQIYNGSAAYDLYQKETYDFYGNAAPEIQRQGLPEERILPEKRQRVKVKAAVAPFALVGLMVVACMLILVVFGYVQLYEATERVSNLKSELNTLQQEQVILESLYESGIDLDYIEYYGNGNMMYHVWANLFDNAVKFSPVGGMIKIRLHKRNKKIIFMIEDNGPGLSEEAQKHLFDKFYQGDSSHKQEGNGLGLALVKRILTISGGNIYVENIATGGCRFTVTLNEN